MELPNALRITRVTIPDEVEAYGFREIEGTEGLAGFNPDDVVFEPLYVLGENLEGAVAAAAQELAEIAEIGELAEFAEAVSKNHSDAEAETLGELTAESFCGIPDKRVLVICDNAFEVGYFSTLLYKNGVEHKIAGAEDYTLNRRIADIFWDFCGDEIDKEAFVMRYLVRAYDVDATEDDALEFYEALLLLCGEKRDDRSDSGVLKIADLTDALNRKGGLISECILNMDDEFCPVTLATLAALSPDDEYDEVMVLTETGEPSSLYAAVSGVFGAAPVVIRKEAISGWMFAKSTLGRPCRVALDNYKGEAGRHCLNVELGLPGDVDGKSFLTEEMGDAIRLQLYIAERIAEGDELTVEKNPDTGDYRFCHKGNVLGEFPQAIIREVCGIEGFPDDFVGFEGVYVRNIVTCVSDNRDPSVPERFRESGIWLGLDITGYAKVIIS